jgi:hypothetical protein
VSARKLSFFQFTDIKKAPECRIKAGRKKFFFIST